jgi:hypothetical protein
MQCEKICPAGVNFRALRNCGAVIASPAMANDKFSPSPSDSAGLVATPADVEAAFEALSPIEARRLRSYAYKLIQGLGRMAMGRSAEGLLQEALTVTLESKRHWKSENVDFCQFLKGVIRSTASNWREKYLRREAHLGLGDGVRMAEVSLGGLGDDDLEIHIPSQDPGPERVLEAKEMVERLQKMAEDHLYVSAILDELLLGLTGPEIQAKLKISHTDYESAMKWLYRTARKSVNKGI